MKDEKTRSARLQLYLVEFLNRFIPAGSKNKTLLRERVLAGYVILQSLIGAGAALAMLMSNWPWHSRWQAALVTLGQALLNLLLLFALKRGVPRGYIINGVVGLSYIIFTVAIIATGGLYTTAVPLLLILVASFAFCLGGERLGLIWSIIILLTLIVIGQTNVKTSVLINFKPDDLKNLSTLVFVITLLALCAVLLIYEQIYSRHGRQLSRERQSYYDQAHTDPLTQLPNRRGFERTLDEQLASAIELNRLVTLVYIDLDGFKLINDRYGHDVGDFLLQEVGRRIELCLRETDLGARLGGDEFGVIIGGLIDMAQTDKVIERLRDAITQAVTYKNLALPFGASFGHATFPAQAHDADSLIQQADQMMYTEKRRRRTVEDYAI
jgi:diguanylate cyclase (GGDEF)-like protein